MAIISETKVSLRFSGDDLEPQSVSEALGLSPTRAFAKGDRIATASNPERIAKTGVWQLRLEAGYPQESFEKQVARLFENSTADLEVWRSLSIKFRGNFFVGLFLNVSNEGFSISPEIVEAIALRGLETGFDIYAPVVE